MFESSTNPWQSRLFRKPKPKRLPGVRHVLAVASGKGGVGRSTVAVNLSLALAHLGYRVGLLDADVHGPNVPLMLGVRRRAEARGWEAILPLASRDLENAPNERIPALDRYGLKVMSVGLLVGDDQAAMVDNAAFVGRLVCNLMQIVEWGDLDVLLVDLPPGTGEPQASLISTVSIDGAAIVVTPQDLALLDSTRAFRAFQSGGVPVLGVIENMSYLLCPSCGKRIQIFHRSQTPRALSSGEVPLLAEIPIEPAISKAGDTGRPLLVTDPDGAQSRIFLDLAVIIAERLRMDGEETEGGE